MNRPAVSLAASGWNLTDALAAIDRSLTANHRPRRALLASGQLVVAYRTASPRRAA